MTSILAADRLPIEIKKQLLLHHCNTTAPKLKNLSRSGNTEASYQLAMCYLNDKSLNKSVYQAIKLLKASANKGHAKAAYLLGTIYYQGDLVEKNISAAKSFLFIAEQKGHRLAKKLAQKIDHVGIEKKLSNKETQKLLEYAARSGNKLRAEDALRSGAKKDQKNSQGNNPLLIAARNKQFKFIRWFLKYKPNLKSVDTNSNTALHFISLAGEINLAERLIQLHAPVNIQNKNGRTPLINAVISGNLKLVKLFLDNGAQVNISDNQQKTAYDYAVNKKAKALVATIKPYLKNTSSYKDLQKRLKQLTKQTQKKDNLYYQWPRIAVAVAQNEQQLVTLLLAQGADPWQQNSQGISAISLAATKREVTFSSLLLKHTKQLTKDQKKQGLHLITVAAKNNNADFVKQLSTHLSPKQPTTLAFTDTPLWTAINSNAELAAIELVKWQQPDFRADDHGRNLLLLAIKMNMPELCSALLMKGFRVNRTDLSKRSSYWYAADRGYIKLMKLLIANHVNIFQEDKEGNTPLHRAVLNGNIEAVAITLNQGAKINKKSKNGNSAIFFAAAKSPEIVNLLISKDANISIRNRHSFTPLMNAVKNKCIKCIQLLLAAGANPSRRNSKGNNSFDLAKENTTITNILNQ